MKFGKNFGGQGFASVMQQMQTAMARAQTLEQELAALRLGVDKGLVKAIFNGTGELVSLKIDPAIVDPEDVEALEDIIVSTVRDGFQQATELRDAKVKEITPNIPNLPL